MKKSFVSAATALAFGFAFATPAFAQEEAPPKPITFSGSATIVSDYRFRGVSQSDKHMAFQAGITATHESGFYAGAWGSNLAGWGQFGGSNTELDLIAGYKRSLGGGVSVDVGLTWYMYPGGADKTDFAEPYVKVSGTAGPVNLLVGVAYAPEQQALGNWSNTPESRIGDTEDNFYIWGDASTAIPSTPVTVKAHLGYSKGNPGLGPNGTSVTPTGSYIDYMVGADITFSPVTFGVSFVGTDISTAKSLYLQPNFSSTKDGSSIASGKVLFSATAAF
ncbi:TorF family putative porin [Sphingomonas immobilis]|uniref:TorF family putative porin n=1 Tax=Sphingomonas immobilis TaxID=3063997 RepID=A0ABT8ZVB9_9SPHN|nr:TorF family putative porin [Sphingomonas sp. CA1-15]MDO7840696.1 TorF family putative porin [Sphingomonas sp. CA1-15]